MLYCVVVFVGQLNYTKFYIIFFIHIENCNATICVFRFNIYIKCMLSHCMILINNLIQSDYAVI